MRADDIQPAEPVRYGAYICLMIPAAERAAATAAHVPALADGLARLLGPTGTPRALAGVVQPFNYTSASMFNFAYGHRVLQEPGDVMPSVFLVPMRKTARWWEKQWMERHTFFLPRYDDADRMLSEGHALAAEAGISCLLRRTYKHPALPAPDGEYDFISYFECADAPVYRQVRDALRDVTRNPEWRYVQEGPTWHGRRVATWAELFSDG